MFPEAMTNMDFFYEKETNWSELYGKRQGFPGRIVDNLEHGLPELPVKVIGMGEPEIVFDSFKKAKDFFGNNLEIAISVPTMLEITHPLATKGNAMDWICDHYHIEPSEMIAVGDSFNDITMIKYAGLGAAMMNGRDEVKAVSDIVVPSNEEDGVAWLIEKYLL